MKTLTINIKQIDFDQILTGKKTVETCNIKPSNSSKYVTFIDLNTHIEYKHWQDIPEGCGDIHIKPVSYEAIRLITGVYNGKKRSCLVEIKEAEVLFLQDENEEQIYYDKDGKEFPAMCIDYFLNRESRVSLNFGESGISAL